MAFVHFSSIFCLYREREGEREGRGSERESERGGGRYMVSCTCSCGFQYVLPHLGVYIHMLKSHIRTSASIHVWLCTWHSP